MSNLDKLFHPFIATHDKDNWKSWTSPRMGYFNHGDIPNVDFNAGFLVAAQVGYMDIPHIHDGCDSYFIFTGADLDRIFESEFEVNFFMGDSAVSMEMYKITKPTFVRVPAGVYHCPIYYKKVVRGGLNNMLWYGGLSTGRVYPTLSEDGTEGYGYEKDNWDRVCVKNPDKMCTWCGLCFDQPEDEVKAYMEPFFKNAATTTKYKDCIMELRQDFHKLGDAVISPRAVFKGVSDMPKTDRQFSFNIITAPCTLGDDEPVSNGNEAEFLWFSGVDVVDAFGCFDAEIEIMLGEDPDNMQKVTFDKPGVVAIPPGTWRGAVTVKRVGKPVCFMPCYPSTKDRYKITQKTVDGEKLLVYNDEKTIKNPTAGDELYLQIKR